ncbi:hypothetical protein [Thermomonas carbonis]|uniref:Uncharacterized protein n=1 Tax=Thermomonas carbonis TaxID=1463158 RepID=A0A7G9SNF6_9GAMM|nr:hypothetical protein [Thermomonas carbonis]QNN69381.1 hypothetical protein H9L16_11945 [Thermomonas carbonis]
MHNAANRCGLTQALGPFPTIIAISASQNEIDISGSVADLREIGLTIRALKLLASTSFTVPALRHDPAPYDRALAEITVTQGSETSVSVQGNALRISATPERLEELASCFFFPEDARDGHHFHFELMPHDLDYSAESLALAVSVHRAGA